MIGIAVLCGICFLILTIESMIAYKFHKEK